MRHYDDDTNEEGIAGKAWTAVALAAILMVVFLFELMN